MTEIRNHQGELDIKKLSRTISLVENEVPGYEEILQRLKPSASVIIGITGAPGAGKSSLVDGLIEEMIGEGKSVAVLCVDPSSPFSLGALLGDRIRMSSWYDTPGVFIRSMATRGALGGLNHKIIEVSDVLRDAAFDYIIIETVGVGQSEVDIASMADVTVVMLIPEGGDSIQNMKAGIMEIADIFVVNKSDFTWYLFFAHSCKGMFLLSTSEVLMKALYNPNSSIGSQKCCLKFCIVSFFTITPSSNKSSSIKVGVAK